MKSAAACPTWPIRHWRPRASRSWRSALAATIEEGPTILPGRSFLGIEDGEYVASVLTGRKDAEAIERTKRGCGMIVNFPKGRGEVFHAGSSDWIIGLTRQDAIVAQVTRNVLNRYLAGLGNAQPRQSDGGAQAAFVTVLSCSCPPSDCTMRLVMARPSPMPPEARLREPSPR